MNILSHIRTARHLLPATTWLPAALAFLFLTLSCQKSPLDSPQDPTTTPRIPIEFGVADKWTKATISNDETLKAADGGFKVWAWFQGNNSGEMFGESGIGVYWDRSKSAWTYENPRYWMPGTYDFFAIHPQNAASVSHTANGYKLTYNVSNQADLIVATNAGIDGSTPPDYVNLNFNHVLSQINFEARSDADDLGAILYGIDFIGICDEGIRYTSGWDASSTGVQDGEYIHNTPATDIPTDMYKPIVAGIMMIPQTLTNVKIRVRYYGQKADGKLGELASEPISLLTEECTEWLPGYKYTYQIPVKHNGQIQINTPEITKWESVSGGSFIVNTPN